MGFIGPSGSGKTAGALLVAYGMMREAYPNASDEEIWSKIGVVDTEHRRAKLYANLQFDEIRIGSFKHIDFTPPYTTERYQMAVEAIKNAGAEVVVIDSLSHNWQGKVELLKHMAACPATLFKTGVNLRRKQPS